MDDPDIRFALLCGIIGVSVVVGAALIAWHMRRSYWRKLRQAGDSRAKRRELEIRRKRR